MFTQVRSFRSVLFGMVALAGLALTSSAFAGHVGVSVNVGVPGLGLGFSSCGHHCGWGGHGGYGYANVGYYGGYVAPTYYAPVYYSEPAYGVVYDYPVAQHGYHERHRERHFDHGRHHDHGDRGYDRDRDYGHDRYYNHDGDHH